MSLKPRIGGWNLILAGSWNTAIFTPDWLIGRVTDSKGIGIEMGLELGGLRVRYRFDDVALDLRRARLQLSIDRPEDKLLQRIEGIAQKLLKELPQTPIRGVGINFAFVEEAPPKELIDLFAFPDSDKLADQKLVPSERSVVRSFPDGDTVLNLTTRMASDGRVLFDFNFHLEVPGATVGAAKLAAHGPVSCRMRAIDVLGKVYGLTADSE